jgi:hypothetical protein
MTATLRRARGFALLASACTLAVLAACTGRNDGRRDAAGLSSNGAGPLPPPGPRAGENTDTSMIAPAASAPTGGSAAGANPAGAPTAAAPAAAPAAPAPATKAP